MTTRSWMSLRSPLALRLLSAIGAAVVIGLVVGAPSRRSAAAVNAASPGAPRRGGSTLQDLLGSHAADVNLHGSERTMIVFLSPACSYCVDGVPLYRTLADVRDRAHHTLQIVVVGREPVEHLRKFVMQHRFLPDGILSISPAHLNVPMLPTIVVVNRTGIVERVWEGEQVGSRAAALLDSVRSVTGTP